MSNYKIILVKQGETYEDDEMPELVTKEVSLKELLSDYQVKIDHEYLGFVNHNDAKTLDEKLKLKPNFVIYDPKQQYANVTAVSLENLYYHYLEKLADGGTLFQQVDPETALPDKQLKELREIKKQKEINRKRAEVGAKTKEKNKIKKELEKAKKLLEQHGQL